MLFLFRVKSTRFLCDLFLFCIIALGKRNEWPWFLLGEGGTSDPGFCLITTQEKERKNLYYFSWGAPQSASSGAESLPDRASPYISIYVILTFIMVRLYSRFIANSSPMNRNGKIRRRRKRKKTFIISLSISMRPPGIGTWMANSGGPYHGSTVFAMKSRIHRRWI